MHKIFDPPISPEALQRMSFEEKYEGFCVDLVKVDFIYYCRGVVSKERERASVNGYGSNLVGNMAR